MEWYWDLYVPEKHRRLEPEASPLRAAGLRGVAPATLVIASGDPLRDEELEYASRLKEVGVPVEVKFVQGVPHLFHTFPPMLVRGAAIAAGAGAVRAHI